MSSKLLQPKINAKIVDIKRKYDSDGVLSIKSIFNPGQIKIIRNRISKYIKSTLPNLPAKDYVLESDGSSIRNLWRMDRHDSFFRALGQNKKIHNLMGKLVDGEPELVAVETFNKPALVGSGIPFHQDNAYFCQKPADMLTMWLAIDPVTERNGPVTYILGSHKIGILPHERSGLEGNSMKIKDKSHIPDSEKFCGTLNPGDALLHHCLTIHQSAPNTSEKSRLGLLFIYRGIHTKEDPNLKSQYTNIQY